LIPYELNFKAIARFILIKYIFYFPLLRLRGYLWLRWSSCSSGL